MADLRQRLAAKRTWYTKTVLKAACQLSCIQECVRNNLFFETCLNAKTQRFKGMLSPCESLRLSSFSLKGVGLLPENGASQMLLSRRLIHNFRRRNTSWMPRKANCSTSHNNC